MGADRLVIGLEGNWPSAQEVAWLQQWNPFGVILFSRNVTGPSQLKKLCSFLHTLVPELQIMADHEGGPVSQLAQALGRPPAAWSLGSLDDTDLTRRVHERTGALMVAAGVSWVLAPCADVMTNPENPVIGVRAFGSEPDVVARHVRAAVEGLLAGGVQVCLKHWPGHGSAGQDSHLERTVVDADSLAAAAQPFHAGLAAGAKAIMVGHLCTTADARALPSTMDASFLKGTLEKFAASGISRPLIVADDITMGGLLGAMATLGIVIDHHEGPGLLDPATLPMAWFAALEDAGCDILLIRGIPTMAYPVAPGSGSVAALSPEKEPTALARVGEYHEVRSRAAVQSDFFDSDGSVLWVDLTVGDRWAVAAGTTSGGEVDLEKVLGTGFGEVARVFGDQAVQGNQKNFERLVLVCHRPLPWDELNIPAWLEALGSKGHAVVMGHPSLGADLFTILPEDLKANWLITAVYDVTGHDLLPFV
jgi:hypothetical protein